VLYADLAKRGRQRVLDNYTQEQIARQTHEVYLEMENVPTTSDLIKM